MENDSNLELINNLLNEELEKYKDLPVNKIKKKLNLKNNCKNENYTLFKHIILKSKNSDKILDLIEKLSCVIKTINLEWNNKLKESLSLKVFKYETIINELWDNSELKHFFSTKTFIFVLYKKGIGETFLENIKIWKMPEYILENEVKKIWSQTKKIIEDGNIISYIDSRGRYITNFPNKTSNKFVHVRPHAQNRLDTYPLPTPDLLTGRKSYMKHSFWLNNTFIKKIVVEGKYYD